MRPLVATMTLAVLSVVTPAQTGLTRPDPVTGSGAGVRVHVVASTDGAFLRLPTEPAAASIGALVFYGERKDGRVGIYTSSGGSVRPVAQVSEQFMYEDVPLRVSGLGRHPTVNASQEYVFLARFDGDEALVARAGAFGPIEFVADTGEAFREFGEHIDQNADGHVLFVATVDPPGHPDREDRLGTPAEDQVPTDPDLIPAPVRMTREGQKSKHDAGVFLDTGIELHVVGGTHADFLDIEDGVAINDKGLVVYRSWARGGRLRMTLQGPDIFPQTLTRTGVLFETLGLPAINNRGEVVYWAGGPDGEAYICRSRRGSGTPERIAQNSGQIRSFGQGVATDDRGRILYVERHEDGEHLVEYADGKGPVELIRSGTVVKPGRRIQTITVGPRAYAGWGRIVVRAVLEPGEVEAILLLFSK